MFLRMEAGSLTPGTREMKALDGPRLTLAVIPRPRCRGRAEQNTLRRSLTRFLASTRALA